MSGIGVNCRPVKHKFVYGMAMQFVPKNIDGGEYKTYSFRICEPKEETREKTNGSWSVSYTLQPTDRTVMATNTASLPVLAGNKVVLTEDTSGSYDVYCDCRTHQFGVIIEPSLGMWDPKVPPNFTFCDKDGKVFAIKDLLHKMSCRNALCAGLLMIPEKEYHAVQAEYHGDEVDVSGGTIIKHTAGGKKLTKDGKPLYYRRRELVVRNAIPQHCELTNVQLDNKDAKAEPTVYANSPFMYQYSDGTTFGVPGPMFFHKGHLSEKWKTTTDINDAMLNYDCFLCPKQADNELFPAGTVVEILRDTATMNYVPADVSSETQKVIEKAIPYYEILPPTDVYYAPLKGQALTYGVFFSVSNDTISETGSNSKPKDVGIKRTLCRGYWDPQPKYRTVEGPPAVVPVDGKILSDILWDIRVKATEYISELAFSAKREAVWAVLKNVHAVINEETWNQLRHACEGLMPREEFESLVEGWKKYETPPHKPSEPIQVVSDSGTPYEQQICAYNYVVNDQKRYPCRGVFYVEGQDGSMYSQLCVLNCELDFGVPVYYHKVSDTNQKIPHYYTIKREWVKNAFGTDGRWELVIHPDFPYKSRGEMPKYQQDM